MPPQAQVAPAAPWWRNRLLWIFAALAAILLMVLLYFTTPIFHFPRTVGAAIGWVFALVMIGIVYAILRGLTNRRVAGIVAVVLGLLLFLPLGLNGILALAHSHPAVATATGGTCVLTDPNGNGTPDQLENGRTEPSCSQADIIGFYSAQASASPAASASASASAAAPASTAPASAAAAAQAGTTQSIVVTGRPADNAKVGRAITIEGTGVLPEHKHLVAFVWAPGAQQWFFDGQAVQTVGTDVWTFPQVCIGANAADVGSRFTVSLRWVDDKTYNQLASDHATDSNAPVELAGSLVTTFHVILGDASGSC